MAIAFTEADWAYKRTVTLKSAQIGYAMPDDGESGYPVPVMIAPEAANDPTDFATTFAYIADPTKDICFTANPAGANILPHVWRSPTLFEDDGDPRLHGIVLVPSYSAVADTTIIQWERDDGGADLQQPEELFTVADGYAASYGLDEAAGALLDDTTNSLDGTRQGCIQGSGVLGTGQSFDGASHYINLGTGTVAALLHGAAATSISFWFNADTLPPNNGNRTILNFVITSTSTGHAVHLIDEAGVDKLRIAGRSTSADALQSNMDNFNTVGSWVHLVAIWDYANDQIRYHIDGGAADTTAVTFGSTTYVDANNQSAFDSISRDTDDFDGLLDEFCIRDVAPSANRVSEDYNWIDNNVARLGFGARAVRAPVPVRARLVDRTQRVRLSDRTQRVRLVDRSD